MCPRNSVQAFSEVFTFGTLEQRSAISFSLWRFSRFSISDFVSHRFCCNYSFLLLSCKNSHRQYGCEVGSVSITLFTKTRGLDLVHVPSFPTSWPKALYGACFTLHGNELEYHFQWDLCTQFWLLLNLIQW